LLQDLGPIHAFNDAFFIWYEGSYGTINTFRLGKLEYVERRKKEQVISKSINSGRITFDQYTDLSSSKSIHAAGQPTSELGSKATSPAAEPEYHRPPPEWTEVNTAWGMSAMLLSAIAQNIGNEGFKFSKFNIVPLGAYSTVERRSSNDSKIIYNLFYDEDRAGKLSKMISGVTGSTPHFLRSFNLGMAAFVICMDELMKYALKSPAGKKLRKDLAENFKSVKIPSTITEATLWESGIDVNKCIVDGCSVEMPSVYTFPNPAIRKAESRRWVRALYGILNNLKWLLVWVVQVSKDKRSV